MKYSIPFAIFITLLTSSVFAQKADHNEQVKAQLYERMAADSFAIYMEVQYSKLPDEDKKGWFRKGATSAFRYWLTTRKGNIRISTMVDSAIAMFYEEAIKSDMSEVFSDPLLRLDSKDPERVGISGFPKISQNEYLGYTKEFKEYLQDILNQRVNRFKR